MSSLIPKREDLEDCLKEILASSSLLRLAQETFKEEVKI